METLSLKLTAGLRKGPYRVTCSRRGTRIGAKF